MIESLALVRFKGFEKFTVRFGQGCVLVGPNNAGKSTIISALRLCAAAVRLATRRRAHQPFRDQGRSVVGYPLAEIANVGFVSENVRYEFRSEEARLELKFGSGAVMKLVWPADGDDQEPFMWVYDPDGPLILQAPRARSILSSIGVIPTLTPLESSERRLEPTYLREMVETRLSSRHFRNNLRVIHHDVQQWSSLRDFLLVNTPELGSIDLVDDYRDGNIWIDLYFRDRDSRVEKELFWAGDGVQIWLQLLYHVWRARASDVIVLDEPDVFLHPDLQRRLMRVLEDAPGQVVLASHAAEIVAEAAPGTVTWIERTRRASRRASTDQSLGQLSHILGTGFNLAIARALRSRVALFVEGNDMPMIRAFAKGLALDALANERHIAVIPIGGFGRWRSVEAFGWLKAEFLGESVKAFVLLDRDYRSDAEAGRIESELGAVGVEAHVWKRKEIENYLLEVDVLGRLSGATAGEAARYLNAAIEESGRAVEAQFVAAALDEAPPAIDRSTVTLDALRIFRQAWADADRRLELVPGKSTLARFNELAQASGRKAVNSKRLAGAVGRAVAPEVCTVLERVERAVSGEPS